MKRRRRTPILAPPFLLVVFVALVLGCARASDRDTGGERNLEVARGYIDAMNRGDASELDADGFKAMHAMVLAAFTNLTITADDMIASGDEVVTRWTLRGKQEGPFQGIAPTGEEWEQADIMGLMRQLGAPEGPDGAT